ncbi:MAG: hypothetical protein U1A27_14290 [Phycisphaerae bacterium]
MRAPERPSPPSPPADDAEHRATLARPIGLIFQLCGGLLALSGCCIWSFSGLTQPRIATTAPAGSTGDWLAAAGGERLWQMGAVVVTFAGGLTLAAAGVGLMADRLVAGQAALVATALGAAFWLGRTIALFVAGAALRSEILALAMLVVWGLFLMLAWLGLDDLRHHPPPPDAGLAPRDLKLDRVTDREMPRDLRER